MHLSMYTAQVAFASCLVLLSFLGNVSLVVIFKLSSKKLICPFSVSSIIFDTMVVLSGPFMFVLSIISKQSWFTEDSKVCYAVEIWQSYSISGSLLAWMLLGCKHRKITTETAVQPKYWTRTSILCSWIVPIVPCCYTLFLRSAKNERIPWSINCLTSTDAAQQVYLNHPILDAVNIFLAVSICTVTARLAYLGRKVSRRKYEVHFEWKRHKQFIRVNSPECSTVNFSESSSFGSMDRRYSIASSNSLNTKVSFVIPTKHFIPLMRKQQNYSTTTENNEVFGEETAKKIPEDMDQDIDVQPRCRHNANSSITENPPNEFTVQTPSEPQSPEIQRNDEMDNSKKEHFLGWEHGIVGSPLSVGDMRQYASPRMSPVYDSPTNTLSFHDIKKLNTTKWLFTNSRSLEFEKTDRESQDIRCLILVTACLSLIGWLWLGVSFATMNAFDGIPEELWLTSTWMIYLRFPFSAFLFTAHFAEEWLLMSRAAWFRLGKTAPFELSTDIENSLKVADPRAVELKKLSIFVR